MTISFWHEYSSRDGLDLVRVEEMLWKVLETTENDLDFGFSGASACFFYAFFFALDPVLGRELWVLSSLWRFC